MNVLVGGVVGNAAAGFTGQVLSNLATHSDLWSGVGFATVLGGVLGGAGGAASEGIASRLSKVVTISESDAYWNQIISNFSKMREPGGFGFYPLPDELSGPIGFRYVAATRLNTLLLGLPGISFSGVDGATDAIWDAAGWPQRF